MDVLILSDIHGNIAALHAVLNHAESKYDIQACVILGDIIDYGMHSNEVADTLKHLKYPVLCNICGNHEYAILHNNYRNFSTDRGRECAQYTERILNVSTKAYIKNEMDGRGMCSFICSQKKCLAVHGSLEDPYWQSIRPDVSPGIEYETYDYVLSGHSHIPHFFERYYKAADAKKRNKKKVIFLNPGSVGQPRNLNNMAQYAVIDFASERIAFEKIDYDICYEQNAIKGHVDDFYSERLEMGI